MDNKSTSVGVDRPVGMDPSHRPYEARPGFRGSANRFMSFGSKHGQFLGVLAVAAGSLFYLAGRYVELTAKNDELTLKLNSLEKLTVEKVARARAEASDETSQLFLMYGYAEEYKRYQEKVSEKANADCLCGDTCERPVSGCSSSRCFGGTPATCPPG